MALDLPEGGAWQRPDDLQSARCAEGGQGRPDMVAELVEEGWAETTSGAHGAVVYRLLKRFDKMHSAAPADSDDGF